MILRKSHYIFHLMKLGISIRLVDYLGNKTMRTTRRKKNRKILHWCTNLNQGSFENHFVM